MNRGDVYWIDFNPSQDSENNKGCSCVIISATPINLARSTVVVIPLSISSKARPPLTIPITSLGKETVAICDQIRAINKNRLVKLISTLSPIEMAELENGLRQILALA